MAGYSQLNYYASFEANRPFVVRKKFHFNGKPFVRGDDFPTQDIPVAKLKRLWQARLIAYNENLMVEVEKVADDGATPTSVETETTVSSPVEVEQTETVENEPEAEKTLDVIIARKGPWYKIIDRVKDEWNNDDEYGKPVKGIENARKAYFDLTGKWPDEE